MPHASDPKQMDVTISDQFLDLKLDGLVLLPDQPIGFVLFAHGSGSSRSSPRNIQVAKILAEAGIATLLFDLLTPSESNDRKNVFNIALLSERLIIATRWIKMQSFFEQNKLGFFGASTGAAAALLAAARLGNSVAGIVSRGGRPDLVPNYQLSQVVAPALLIVGEQDEYVLDWNRNAIPLIRRSKLTVIPGATHLFEEPGALEKVALAARQFFVRCFKEKELERMINLQ